MMIQGAKSYDEKLWFGLEVKGNQNHCIYLKMDSSFLVVVFVMVVRLGIEPRVLRVQCKISTTKPPPTPNEEF